MLSVSSDSGISVHKTVLSSDGSNIVQLDSRYEKLFLVTMSKFRKRQICYKHVKDRTNVWFDVLQWETARVLQERTEVLVEDGRSSTHSNV